MWAVTWHACLDCLHVYKQAAVDLSPILDLLQGPNPCLEPFSSPTWQEAVLGAADGTCTGQITHGGPRLHVHRGGALVVALTLHLSQSMHGFQ